MLVAVRPAGSVSVTVTVVPSVGPAIAALLTVIVYVAPTWPWVKLPAWLFVIDRSAGVAAGLTIVESIAVLFAAVTSPPPLTLALFTCGEVAFAATFTVSVIAG